MKNTILFALFFVLTVATLLMAFLGLREVWFLSCIDLGLLSLVLRQRRFAYLFFAPTMLWVWEAGIRIIRYVSDHHTMNPTIVTLVCLYGLFWVGIGLSSGGIAGFLILSYKAVFSIEK